MTYFVFTCFHFVFISVIFIDKATPATLLEFKDRIANTIVTIEDNWSIEFKIYRSNISIPSKNEKLEDATTNNNNSKNILYSVSFPELEQTVIIKNGMSMLTTTKPHKKLINSSSHNWYSAAFDNILQDKLSNIWNLRQVVKGDAGESFITRDKTQVKCCNLFTSTGFKGLVIQLQRQNLQVENIVDTLHSMGIRDYIYNDETLDPHATNGNVDSLDVNNVAQQFIKVLM